MQLTPTSTLTTVLKYPIYVTLLQRVTSKHTAVQDKRTEEWLRWIQTGAEVRLKDEVKHYICHEMEPDSVIKGECVCLNKITC